MRLSLCLSKGAPIRIRADSAGKKEGSYINQRIGAKEFSLGKILFHAFSQQIRLYRIGDIGHDDAASAVLHIEIPEILAQESATPAVFKVYKIRQTIIPDPLGRDSRMQTFLCKLIEDFALIIHYNCANGKYFPIQSVCLSVEAENIHRIPSLPFYDCSYYTSSYEKGEDDMSADPNEVPVQKLEHSGLNFILAGKWDFVPGNKYKQYIEDRAVIPYAKRTDIETASKRIEGAKVKDSELQWATYPPIDKISKKGGNAEGGNPPLAYEPLIGKKDSPLYGEYQFFSAPIRKIIYNSGLPGSRELSRIFYLKPSNNSGTPKQFSSEDSGTLSNCEYVVQYYDCGRNTLTEYRMPVTDIMLRLFGVGVMMLSIHTQGAEVRMLAKHGDQWRFSTEVQSLSPEEIFCNCGSIGRRMYQPFINGRCTMGDKAYQQCCGCGRNNGGSSGAKYCNACCETAVYSCLLFNRTQIPICYNWDAYPKTEADGLLKPSFPEKRRELHKRFAHPNSLCFLEELFYDNELQEGRMISRERFEELHRSRNPKIVVNPFQDDRMYLHGYYVDASPDGVPTQLKTAYPSREELLKSDNHSDEQNTLRKWYAISQMDRNCFASCQDMEMLRQQIERDTYARWVGWGTAYALTANSCLMVLNDSSVGYLIDNMQWHYFQLFIVALLQRCSTLRFYEEAAAIMNQSTGIKNVPLLCDSLRSQYIIFLNSVWWKEVSLQIQGQEMYRMLSENMEIDDNVKQLDEALSELYEYNEGVYQKKISNSLNLFSIAGVIWAVVELVGFLYTGVNPNEDANIIADSLSHWPNLQAFCSMHPRLATFICCVIIAAITAGINKLVSGNKVFSSLCRKVWETVKRCCCCFHNRRKKP